MVKELLRDMHLRQFNSLATLAFAGFLMALVSMQSLAQAVATLPSMAASPEVTYTRTKKIMETANEIASESAEVVQKFQTFTLHEDFATEAIRKYTASIIRVGEFEDYLDELELDEDAGNLSLTLLKLDLPVRNGEMSSPYGWRHGRPHKGMDFSAPHGSPIYAAQEGRVVFSGWYYGYGYMVTVEHAPGIQTRYAHCSSLLAKTGQYVKRGQMIARIGSTGHSTGPHVHFELLAGEVNIDPKTYLTHKTEQLQASL